MKKILLVLSITLLSFILTGCFPDEDEENVIYVTAYPINYIIDEIAKDTVNVKRVPGSLVHSESIDWKPKEIISMKDSDILFYVNAGLDPYIENSADSTFSGANTKLVDISKAVEYGKVCASHDHAHTADDTPIVCDENSLSYDPHFWLDPVRFLESAVFIKDELIAMYPHYEELYEANFLVLEENLVQLHADYSLMAEQATKPIVTTSMLFNYFSQRYQIEIISIASTPHSGESIPGDLIEYANEIILHNIEYIIFEKRTKKGNWIRAGRIQIK